MATDRKKAIRGFTKGVDRAADEFLDKLDAMQAGLGLVRDPDPASRLESYYYKPDTAAQAQILAQLYIQTQGQQGIRVPYSWETQAARFPKDFDEDWKDFEKLRERAFKGDFGPELQRKELMYQAAHQPVAIAPPMVI